MGQTDTMWMLFPFVLVWAVNTAVSEKSRYGNALDRGDSRGHFDVCDTRHSHRHIKPNGLFLLINKGRPNSSFTNKINLSQSYLSILIKLTLEDIVYSIK